MKKRQVSHMTNNNSDKTDTLDLQTYLYKSELFSGRTPDIRDIRKTMPQKRILKLKKTDTDRSLNKFMDE
jgi:hypothetical protein